jgi:hypothetical protein
MPGADGDLTADARTDEKGTRPGSKGDGGERVEMSVSVTELFTEHTVTVVGSAPAAPAGSPGPGVGLQLDIALGVDEEPEAPWYDGLTFSGPLDPAGTLFAFLLALVATVGVVVMVAAVVRMVSAG